MSPKLKKKQLQFKQYLVERTAAQSVERTAAQFQPKWV
jgi:hypothetical protein